MEEDSKFSETKSHFDSNSEYQSIMSDSLRNDLIEPRLREDIVIFCDLCKEYVYYGDVKMHRKIHKCICYLQIKDIGSLSFRILVKHRSKMLKVIQTLTSDKRLELLWKVDWAYSTLYNYLIEDRHQDIFYPVHMTPKDFDLKEIENNSSSEAIIPKSVLRSETVKDKCIQEFFEIGFCLKEFSATSENGGSSLVIENISSRILCLAVVTGITGNCAQTFVSKNIVEYFRHNFNVEESYDSEKIAKILKEVVINLDNDLSTGLYDNVTYNRWSSCLLEYAILSYMTAEDYFLLSIVNVSDGLIILVHTDTFTILSVKHTLQNEDELQRVKELGGLVYSINENLYLNGIAQVTQVIGGYGNSKLKAFQIPNPIIKQIKLNPKIHLGVIFLNSSITSLISVEDAVAIFRSEIIVKYDEEAITTDFYADDIHDLLASPNESESFSSKENDIKVLLSKVISRKIVSAALMNASFQKDLAAAVILTKSTGI